MTKLHFPSLHCLFLVCICVSTGVGWEVLWCRSVERYTIIEEYSPEATKHSGQRKQFAQVQIVLIFFFFFKESRHSLNFWELGHPRYAMGRLLT